MKSIDVAFGMIENGQVDPVRNKRTSGYMIFYAKIDFTRKVR